MENNIRYDFSITGITKEVFDDFKKIADDLNLYYDEKEYKIVGSKKW